MKQIVDLKESMSGDLVLAGGDIADTGNDYAQAGYQIIKTILNTEVGDCDLYPDLGFNSYLYEGKSNSSATAQEFSQAIKDAITINSFFYANEISVDVFPTGKNTMACKIILTGLDSTRKGYLVVYDTAECMIKSLVLSDNIQQSQTIKYNIPPTLNSRS